MKEIQYSWSGITSSLVTPELNHKENHMFSSAESKLEI